MYEVLINNKDHFYVCNRTKAFQVASQPNNNLTGVVAGQFSRNPNATCGGEFMKFTALYEMSKDVNFIIHVQDHFYTTSQDDVNMARLLYGYKEEGIVGYCAPTTNYCGAFTQFNRMFKPDNGGKTRALTQTK